MNTTTIGTDTYATFEKSDKGNLMMLHFLWGKKDFRLFLEKKKNVSGEGVGNTVLKSPAGEYVMTRLQYLNQFEWYDYDKVTGHGLAHDEVRWLLGKEARFVELPQHFLEVVMDLSCKEFNLKRLARKVMAN